MRTINLRNCQGNLPYLPAPRRRLIPLAKPDGTTRPITIGEVWWRLAAQCVIASCPGVGASLKPLQMEVRVSGESQIVRHALRAGLAAEPGCVTVQLDSENAYNSLRRQPMLMAVAVGRPGLLPLASCTYKQHTRLLVSGAEVAVPSQIVGGLP